MNIWGSSGPILWILSASLSSFHAKGNIYILNLETTNILKISIHGRLIYLFLFFVLLNMLQGKIFFVLLWKITNGVDANIRKMTFNLAILNASGNLPSINMAWNAWVLHFCSDDTHWWMCDMTLIISPSCSDTWTSHLQRILDEMFFKTLTDSNKGLIVSRSNITT